MWIVQEVARAKRLHIIYGRICMDWTYVGRVVAVPLEGPLLDWPLVNESAISSTSVDEVLKGSLVLTGLQTTAMMLSLRGDIRSSISFTLARLLQETKFFNCSDKRDKNFSLLGLATDESIDKVKVDYTAPVHEVYTGTMRYILESETGYRLYSLPEAGIVFPRMVSELPSWVPDWSTESTSELHIWAKHINVGKNIELYICFDESDPSVLHVGGEIIDEISAEGDMCDVCKPPQVSCTAYTTKYIRAYVLETENLAKRTFLSSSPSKESEYELLTQVVFKTLTAGNLDYDSTLHLTPSDLHSAYATLSAYFTEILPLSILLAEGRIDQFSKHKVVNDECDKLWQEGTKFEYLIDSRCRGRRVVVTKKGMVGLVPGRD